jgi:hypothetical protein
MFENMKYLSDQNGYINDSLFYNIHGEIKNIKLDLELFYDNVMYERFYLITDSRILLLNSKLNIKLTNDVDLQNFAETNLSWYYKVQFINNCDINLIYK